MATKPSPLKRAIKAAKQAMEPQRFGISQHPFVCPLCKSDRFQVGLYVPILMMHTLVCAGCSRVEFFQTMPKRLEA